jgi:hypothetical protein
MSTTVPSPRTPLQELSPFGWAAIIGTVFVIVAALAAQFRSGLSEDIIFYLWAIGVILQIVGGGIAFYQRYRAQKRENG